MSNNRLQAARTAREAHRQNIQKTLEHRLQVARDQGDDRLIRQLEAEVKYYA